MFTPQQLSLLLAGKSISPVGPWNSNEEERIDGFYRIVCDEIARDTHTLSQVEWNHYGSGYASFVDAWFYRLSREFSVQDPPTSGEAHVGLVVLLSRLAPWFVLMEGAKSWSKSGGSGYLPCADSVDEIGSEGPMLLVTEVQPILERHGLTRLSAADLATPLPAGMRVPTILTGGHFTEFDALFHWED